MRTRTPARTRRRLHPLLLETLEARVAPAFLAPAAFDAGRGTYSVAVADFNGDSRPDLAAANYFSNDLSVLLGNGDGTFQEARHTPSAGGPATLAVGDVNNDGRPDLAVANFDGNNVGVLLGNGDGSFQAVRNFAAGTRAQAVVVAELNNDGRPDLAVANYGSGNVSVLLGNGDGSFQAAQSFAVGSSPLAMAAADLNADGRLDLATANYSSNTVSVLLGNGDGSFQAAQNLAAGTFPRSVAAGDVNGDGRPDLAVAGASTQQVRLLLGNGDGTFQAALGIPVGSSPFAVAVADVNADGRLDLAAVTGSPDPGANERGLSVLLGNGDGTFSAPQYFLTGNSEVLTAGDVNNDGRLDFVFANGSAAQGLTVLLGNGDGTFGPVASYAAAGRGTTGLAAGDVNNDGRLDLVTANAEDDGLSVLLGNGDGSFQAPRRVAFAGINIFVVAAHLNSDGRLDLVVIARGTHPHSPASIGILMGNGNGTFQAPRRIEVANYAVAVAVADVNGDGRPDLVAANEGYQEITWVGGNVGVYLGNGNGTFQAVRFVAAGVRPVSVAAGDVNGDGRTDLAVVSGQSQAASVSVLVGNGDGTFQAPRPYAAGPTPQSVVMADVNGDGRLDLAVADSSSGSLGTPNTVGVYLGNGDGTFQDGRHFAAGSRPEYLAAGDVNADGRRDLVVTSQYTVRVLLGNGDGTFRGGQAGYVVGDALGQLAAGDFNADGSLDLAVAYYRRNNVGLLFNDGYWGGPVAYYYIYPAGGQVTAGVPFDVYVFALDAQFNLVTNYRGAVAFYATDPQATTPVYYQFQLSDRGLASFPGGVTLRTPGVQELYVFDWPGVQVFGYAAFEVVAAAPGPGGGPPVPDLFAIDVLTPEPIPAGRPSDAAVPSRGEDRPATAVVAPATAALAADLAPLAALRPVLDRLFAGPWAWDAVTDALTAVV